ncbi:MalY/PatB family protein [Rhodobacteraceae bacterium nBUS_24]
MNQFDFNPNRFDTFSSKWDKFKGRDVLPMGLADTDFKVATPILNSLRERTEHGVFGYTRQPLAPLVDATIGWLSDNYEWQIEPEWLVWLPCLVSGLNLACQISGKPGDEVLTPKPIYTPFMTAPSNAGRTTVTVPLKLIGDRWVLNAKALEDSITPSSKTLLLCNPQNPAGTVYTKAELLEIYSICKKHSLIICSDEIHCDLILDTQKKHIPIATIQESDTDRTITLMSASKTFNIAGLSCGFAVIPNPNIRAEFNKTKTGLMPDINLFGQIATMKAFTECRDWLHEQVEYLRINRDYLLNEINELGTLKMRSCEASFLAWIDVSQLGHPNAAELLEQFGVGVTPGILYGDSSHIRLNFGCNHETLRKAIHRIKLALSSLS